MENKKNRPMVNLSGKITDGNIPKSVINYMKSHGIETDGAYIVRREENQMLIKSGDRFYEIRKAPGPFKISW